MDGSPLTMETNGLGALVVRCVGCERRRAHRCMDCTRPVKGRAWRCEDCKERARKVSEVRYRLRVGRETLCEREKRRYREDAELRRRRNEYKRRWREANPMKVAMQKRRARLAGKPGGYATREKYEAYQRAYRKRHAGRRRDQALAAYYAKHPDRPTPSCRECRAPLAYSGKGRPPAWCTQHRPHAYTPKSHPTPHPAGQRVGEGA